MTLSALFMASTLLVQTTAPTTSTTPARPAKATSTLLEGVVLDANARPVEGALVVVRLLQGSTDLPQSVRTNRQGTFRLKLPGRPLITVMASARDLAPTRMERIRPDAPLKITLQAGGSIDGTVRDGFSKQPLAGVRVEARTGVGQDVPWEWGSGVVETVSEADGRFRLAGLGEGLHRVVATAPGWGRAQRDAVRVGARVELFLFPRAIVSGQITDRDGRPVADASVFAEREAAMGGSDVYQPVRSDRAGMYEIVGLEAGSYRIVALERQHAPGFMSGIVVGRQDDLRIDLMLDRGVDVTGRLVDPEQRPVPGKVTIVDLDSQRVSPPLAQVLRAETGADGVFRVKLAPPGLLGLATEARGFAAKRIEASVGGEPLDLGNIELETGDSIRGRVRDSAGVPVADARVSAMRSLVAARMRPDQRQVSTTSDADGRFALAGLTAGPYQVHAEAMGFGSATRPAETGGQDLELVLQPAGTLSGRVVDDSGATVGSFRISAREAGRPMVGNSMPLFAGKSVDGGDGTFSLEDLTAGEYVVEISAPDLTPHVTSKITVSAGANTDLGRVVLRRGGVVKGTVVDSNRSAVPGANIQLEGRVSYSALRVPAQTGAGGEFELRGIEPGRVDLLATHPDYAEGRVSGIEVDPTKGPSETQIVLTRGGRIEGLVRKRDGTSVGGMAVGLHSMGPSGQPRFSRQGLASTRSDGSFVFERVTPGRVTLTLMAGRDGVRTSTQIKEADVTDGATTQVDFILSDILISGYARRNGAPLAGGRIEIRPRDARMVVMSASAPPISAPATGPERNTATVQDDGRFDLVVDSAGSHMVVLTTGDDKTRFPPRMIEVPDADTFALDLDYTSVRVEGLVTGEDDRPLQQVEVNARGAGAVTGSDGRFVLDLEVAGHVTLTARAEGYAALGQEINVPSTGLSDVKLTLKRGGDLSGRVVDSEGRGVVNAFVFATPAAEQQQPSIAMQPTLPDGTFVVRGVTEGRQTLLARTMANDAFAILPDVVAGARDVLLTLRPAGRVALRITEPDGEPRAGATASCARVNGAMVTGVGGIALSDAQGMIELSVPSGTLEIVVHLDKRSGKTSVSLAPGQTVSAEVALRAGPE